MLECQQHVSLETYRDAVTGTTPIVQPSFAMGLTMFGKTGHTGATSCQPIDNSPRPCLP